MLTSKRVARLQKRAACVSEQKAEISTKAAAYLRVSTEEQAQHGSGLASQERAIRAFAASQGYTLAEVVSDAGVSGASRPADRPGYARLLELAEAKAFSVLLVWKFDRLARQIVFAVTAVNDLSERFGVVIRSVTEPIDTATPMGRTVFAVLAGMAEQERHAITERTHGGRREKAAKGGFACGSAPFGYRADGTGLLHVVESEAETVRKIFELRRQGQTLQQIADRLSADLVPTRRGGKWRPGQVAYLLDNPKYFGRSEYLFRYGGTETHVLRKGKHRPIINTGKAS